MFSVPSQPQTSNRPSNDGPRIATLGSLQEGQQQDSQNNLYAGGKQRSERNKKKNKITNNNYLSQWYSTSRKTRRSK